MSHFLGAITGTDRAIFLKEKVRLYAQQKVLAELEGQAQLLQTRKHKYEKAGEGLMQSAISVMPRDGSYLGASVVDRVRWAEKALSLREISVNNSKEAARELSLIEPLKNQAEYNMRMTTERLEDLERELKLSYKRQLLIKEELDLQDIGENYLSNDTNALFGVTLK